MSAFLSAFFANILGPLSLNFLNSLKFSDRKRLSDPEANAALHRCLKAGLVAVARKVSAEAPEGHADLLKEILEGFFTGDETGPAAGKELGKVLSGDSPNIGELREIFEYAGYDSETLPGVPFEEAMDHFQVAFREAAMEEAALHPFIQAQNQADQTEIQRETLAEIREMVALLRRADPKTVRVVDGVVAGEDRDTGALMVLERGVRIEGDAVDSIIATGDNNRIVRAVTYIQNQYNYAAPAVPLDPSKPPDNWESAYLNRLMDRCDPLDLALVDDTCFRDGNEARMVRVSDVYTKLFLTGRGRRSDESVVDAVLNPPKPEEMEGRRPQKEEEERIPIQAVEAIGGLDRLVVLGQPGGGKSTLVNHVTAHLARLRSGESELAPLSGWNPEERLLPVRVILRDFAAWVPAGAKGTEQLVWDYLEEMVREWACPDFFPILRRELEYEGGAVFFDGLDEVSEADESKKRTRLVSAIEAFARSLRKCRVMVTCREYAYRGSQEWRLPADLFPVVELDRFREEQIRSFLTAWFSATREHRGWSREKAETEAGFLFQEISDREHLRELAPNPLLLTLMAIVHGASGLPENRADLYERAVLLLLAAWENRVERDANGCRVRPSEIAKLGIPVRTLRGPLERLAVAVHEKQEAAGGNRSGQADISRIAVMEELCATLGDDVVKARAVVDYIENRAGLLQGHCGNTFRFPHRTFQEYLTATGLLRRSDPETALADRVRRNPDFWREVFLLAAGASRGRPKGIYDQLDALLPEYCGQKSPTHENALYAWLSAKAIHETGFMEHVLNDFSEGRFKRIHMRVQQWLLFSMEADQTFEPGERNVLGTALNWVGDPRFREDFHFLPNDDLLGFVHVSGGSFQMGGEFDDDEKPRHEVVLPEFYIARFPVTVAQFRAYVNATGERPEDEDSLKGPDNHPVVNVTWPEAMAYCRWLQTVLEASEAPTLQPIRECLAAGWRVRLPTEAEWERAARGTVGTEFPWGNEADPNRANYDKSEIGGTSAVGCFPGGRTPAECFDMSGNVWEWTVSLWGKDLSKPDFKYPYRHDADWNNETADNEIRRVVRGGAFISSDDLVRCASRFRLVPDFRHWLLGFRFCVAPNPTLASGNSGLRGSGGSGPLNALAKRARGIFGK